MLQEMHGKLIKIYPKHNNSIYFLGVEFYLIYVSILLFSNIVLKSRLDDI